MGRGREVNDEQRAVRDGQSEVKDEQCPRWWSWKTIVQHADRLGIPNFQRGAVWSYANRDALLESIYEQSPCGSFVLWQPDEGEVQPRDQGVPLRRFADGVEPMWLVDGQQRTRAMLDTFQQLIDLPDRADGWSLVRKEDLAELRSIGQGLLGHQLDEEEEADDRAEDEPHVWMVHLPAMRCFDLGPEPYFGDHSVSNMTHRGAMFRHTPPRVWRRRRDSRTTIEFGLVPLATLLAPGGVFHDPGLREEVRFELRQLSSDSARVDRLDVLLPWGPQFVTGYAYEESGLAREPAEPMRWSRVRDRWFDRCTKEVALLAGLFDEDRWSSVFKRFSAMLDGKRFAVGWLPGTDARAAIDAYVRINRAGVRVRNEERALAVLSRARPELLKDLARFIARRDDQDEARDRRSLLTHASDRHIGFGVWVTTVTRYTALAALGGDAVKWLGLSAIDKRSFDFRLDQVGRKNAAKVDRETWAREDYESSAQLVGECTARAEAALLLIDDVLSNELRLDHRMARPSAHAIYPIIDLLYAVPTHQFERLKGQLGFREALGRLLHWTLLAPDLTQADRAHFVAQIHGADDSASGVAGQPLKCWGSDEPLEDALRSAFLRYRRLLREQWVEQSTTSATLGALCLERFRADVDQAMTLQSSAVGWLYAIERGRRQGEEAREFSWEAQVEGFRTERGRVGVQVAPLDGEAPLSRSANPDLYAEKQHIIPFSIAKQIVQKRGSRQTRSRANAVGNLTWLSSRQNGLGKHGLADRWAVLDRERDAENLKARGLMTVTADGDAVWVYEQLQKALSAKDSNRAQELFTTFCEARSEWMIGKMEDWLKISNLTAEAIRWLSIDE